MLNYIFCFHKTTDHITFHFLETNYFRRNEKHIPIFDKIMTIFATIMPILQQLCKFCNNYANFATIMPFFATIITILQQLYQFCNTYANFATIMPILQQLSHFF